MIILLLTISSMISLIADTESIKIRGTIVVYRPVGETSGICCRRPIIKKNTFAHLLNCSNRNNGINLITLQQNIKRFINLSPSQTFEGYSPIFSSRYSIVNELNNGRLCPVNKYHAFVLFGRMCILGSVPGR